MRAPAWVKHLAPDSPKRIEVIGGWQGYGLLLHQQPGDGRGVAQVHGQFQVWGFEKGMLAGQAAHSAGQIGEARQMAIPQGQVALGADAIQAMAALIVQSTAQR